MTKLEKILWGVIAIGFMLIAYGLGYKDGYADGEQFVVDYIGNILNG